MGPLTGLEKHPLFISFEAEQIAELFGRAGAYEERFPAKSAIGVFSGDTPRVGFLLEGRATVTSRGAILNRLSAPACFGVAQIYAPRGDLPTRITAKTPCRAVFLKEKDFDLLLADPRFARNLAAFLADRIRFLNRRIAAFTAPDARLRAAFYLSELAGSGESVILNFSAMARELDLGRASLYRALDALESEGLIEKRGKTVRIPDPAALRRLHSPKTSGTE